MSELHKLAKRDKKKEKFLLNEERMLELVSASSFRKLLGSHLSIYNALTNPDLDFNISSPPKESARRFTTPPPLDFAVFGDPSASLQSWQSINLNSESLQDIARQLRQKLPTGRPASASILSSTSDEDAMELLVLVPAAKRKSSKVMVFETDEEDTGDDNEVGDVPGQPVAFSAPEFGDDDKTLTVNLNPKDMPSLLQDCLQNSFIMPKMSLSDSSKRVQLTILSLCDGVLRAETDELVRFIKKNVQISLRLMQVTHMTLKKRALKFDLSLIRNSDMLFIVNDGSLVFGECLAAACSEMLQSELPELTMINIMTSNYFINLFDIINTLKPHQIWKAPSLKSEKLLLRIKNYIESEVAVGNFSRFEKQYNAQHKKFSKTKKEASKTDAGSVSMYDGLVPARKPDYKLIERQIRTELLMSLSYSNTDPLKLSSNLDHFNALLELFRQFFGSRTLCSETNRDLNLFTISSSKLWLVCSFSIGIGVGITCASGASNMLAIYVRKSVKGYWAVDNSSMTQAPQQLIVAGGTSLAPVISKLSEMSDSVAGSCCKCFDGVLNAMLRAVDNQLVFGLVSWFNSHFQNLQSLSSLVVDSARGGLEKATALVASCIGKV